MENETPNNRLTANICNVLLVAVFLLILIGVAYKFGKELNKDIQHKKEVDSLTMERLKLEIELKKLEMSRKNGN